MAKVIPVTFPARSSVAHRRGEVIDIEDIQDVIEGSNWLFARRRRLHAVLSFMEGDPAAPTQRLVETVAALRHRLTFPIFTGSSANPGVRLQYLIAAEQAAAAGNGTVDVRVLDTALTLFDTKVVNPVQAAGVQYFSVGPTAKLAPDTEFRIEVRLQSGAGGTNLTLRQISVYEVDTLLADMP